MCTVAVSNSHDSCEGAFHRWRALSPTRARISSLGCRLLAATVFAALTARSTYAQCAAGCSGNGVCGPASTCVCFPTYSGPTCAERTCPNGPAWAAADRGARARAAHGNAECSAAGTCQRSSGLCDCLPGFSGEACESSACAQLLLMLLVLVSQDTSKLH